MIPVPKTLEEAIAKLMEVLSYLQTEDSRREQWEAEIFEDVRDIDDRLATLEMQLPTDLDE